MIDFVILTPCFSLTFIKYLRNNKKTKKYKLSSIIQPTWD